MNIMKLGMRQAWQGGGRRRTEGPEYGQHWHGCVCHVPLRPSCLRHHLHAPLTIAPMFPSRAAAAARGWQAGEGGLLEVPAPAAAAASGGAAEAAAQRSLQRLTEYVVHLES